MTAQSGVGLLHDLVERCVPAHPAGTASSAASQTLLADLLACVLGAGAGAAPTGWSNDGTVGVAAALAGRAHALDQDDIHWPTNLHPGSVVWPVVLAVGAEVSATGEQISAAARAGYEAMTSLAHLFGPAHGRHWHATATCGALGAALPAALLLGLAPQERDWACGHAMAMAAGVGQAVVERSATTRFHRVATAALGIQAARFGQARIPCSARTLEGSRGVFALLAPDREPGEPTVGGGALEGSSVRVFPTNGLAQAAVALSADLSLTAQGVEPTALVVEVSPSVAAATSGEVGGAWWDLRSAVAAAWASGDPFVLTPTARSQRVRDLVRVTSSASPGVTRVSAHTARGDLSGQLESAPGSVLGDPGLAPLLSRKWSRLAGARPDGASWVRTMASNLLSEGPTSRVLAALLDG